MNTLRLALVLTMFAATACEENMNSATDSATESDSALMNSTDSDACTVYVAPGDTDTTGNGSSAEAPVSNVDDALDKAESLEARCGDNVEVRILEGSASDAQIASTESTLKDAGYRVTRTGASTANSSATTSGSISVDSPSGMNDVISGSNVFNQASAVPLAETTPWWQESGTSNNIYYYNATAGQGNVSIGENVSAVTRLQVLGTEAGHTYGAAAIPTGVVRLKSLSTSATSIPNNANYMFLDGNEIDTYSTATNYPGTTLFLQFNSRGNTVLNRNGGNVGIGTQAPTHTLTVKGTVKAEALLLDTVVGADFVFEDDYNLMCIDEVEKFVEKNNHLPGIASAADMQKNGVSMGEFQIQLLQKIEELTLYMIEQNKLNKEQSARIKDLEQKCGQ